MYFFKTMLINVYIVDYQNNELQIMFTSMSYDLLGILFPKEDKNNLMKLDLFWWKKEGCSCR